MYVMDSTMVVFLVVIGFICIALKYLNKRMWVQHQADELAERKWRMATRKEREAIEREQREKDEALWFNEDERK